MTFTPLRVRSHGSLLCGVASPEAVVGRAVELGYDALALTDRDNLYLAVRFYRAALEHGVRPLLGVELTARVERERGAGRGRGRVDEGVSCAPAPSLLLVPVDRRGYANLCALVTRRHLDSGFDLVEAVCDQHAGLHVIVESPGMAAALLRGGVPAAVAREARGRHSGLWIGVRGLSHERARLAERLDAARALGVPAVATGDASLLQPGDLEAHRAVVTAATGELLDRMPPSAFASKDAWLAAPEEWARRIAVVCSAARRPEITAELLANNRILAERCRLELELGTPIFPRAPLPDGVSGEAHLRELCRTGLKRRYDRPGRARARARLDHELSIIQRMGFTDYFLLVAEIVGFARKNGIPTVGRGSGAASIVSYVLGITNVDPIRYELCFERFLNSSRRDCPDLDIDMCWRRRDDVIAHVYDTYGHDRVAMISTHATLGARSAFRETAKALGVPNDRVNRLAKRIPRSLDRPYIENLRAFPDARAVDWTEPVLAESLRLAESVDGAPRHLSVHCAGIVIADRPLTDYVPLQRAAKDVVVTQFEMRAIEAIGLVKMDLLGNRALSTIGECTSLVREHRGISIDVDRLPEPEPETVKRLRSGDTLNCFQLESPAMRHLLRMLQCETLDETIAAVALVRPGPAESGMKAAYCRRKRGLEQAQYHHPRLEPVLGGTLGVMLYEEDVLRVAAGLTGLSLSEGDDLRRALGAARTDDEFRSLEQGFVFQARRAGIDTATARIVWRDLTRFAAYGFCKAHAAGYGTLGYQCTYLKAHHPTEFAVGILNHHAGMYSTWVHVEDLRRCGVEFRPPCVQKSAWDSTLEVEHAAPGSELSPERDAWPGPHFVRSGGTRAAMDGGAWPDSRSERGITRAARRRAKCGRGQASLSPALSGFTGSPACSISSVRVGLSRIHGLHERTGERIVSERARRSFGSLADFTGRVRPSIEELEMMILAGAFDWTGRSRPSLLLEARVNARANGGARGVRRRAEPERVVVATAWDRAGARSAAVSATRFPVGPADRRTEAGNGPASVEAPLLSGPDGISLEVEASSRMLTPALPEFAVRERVIGECRSMGIWFSGHPLVVLVPATARAGTVPAASIPALGGRRVSVAGLPCAYRRVETKQGGQMLFMTLADESGLVECTLFPDTYRRLAAATRGQVVRVEGLVESALDAISVTVENVETLA